MSTSRRVSNVLIRTCFQDYDEDFEDDEEEDEETSVDLQVKTIQRFKQINCLIVLND